MKKVGWLFLKKSAILIYWLAICYLLIIFPVIFSPFEGLSHDISYINFLYPWFYFLKKNKGWLFILCFLFAVSDFFFPVHLKQKHRKKWLLFRLFIALAVILPFVCWQAAVICLFFSANLP